MENFCTKCGTKLTGGNFCVACGTSVKKCGKGFSIASLVLGIIALLFLFVETTTTILELQIELEPYFNKTTFIKSVFGYMSFYFLISTVGLVLGLIAFFKNRNGINIAGVCLNALGLIGFICFFVYYVSLY